MSTKDIQDTLTLDLDELMQKHSERFEKGIFFSGMAMPSQNENRFTWWSCSGGFQNKEDFNHFLNAASIDSVSQFCSYFTCPSKLKMIKTFLAEEALTQKEVQELSGLNQEEFQQNIKELKETKFVQLTKENKYDLSPMGHALSISFLGIVNTFLK